MTQTTPGPRPPADTFWETYSPNGEGPVSGLTSLVVHGLVVAAVIFGAGLIANLIGGRRQTEIPLEPVTYGGGGGNELGVSPDNRGDMAIPRDQSEPLAKPPESSVPLLPGPTQPDLPIKAPPPSPFEDDPTGSKAFEQAVAQRSELANLGPNLRTILNGLTGKGKRGPGRRGGDGPGDGPGTGPGRGPGTGNSGRPPESPRFERMLRWTMLFNTSGGEDYLRQLHALGAILGVQDDGGQIRIYRNLRERPLKGKVEDLKDNTRIFWVDNNPDSMTSMAQAMGLEKVPAQIIAFFPETIEQQLLKAELDYGRPRGRRTETDIAETKFRISFPGGRTKVEVAEQTGK